MSYPRQPALHSASGSALVLTLLVTALLATIVVSFLSTSRVEQIAARNFSRQNAASGLAELATQQAMAKIQQGFTVSGNDTTVITTQPGAIWQYTFSGGNCSAVSGKNPVDLFTTNGTIDANLNNLQNPSSNSCATTNQFTITGNASEQINVPLENITSNGTIIGRIAYYVDDEGTKLNVNNAIGERSTLNAGGLRSLSFSALSSNYSANFTALVDGSAGNDNSIVKNWAHFFRPEQVGAALGNHSSNNSTAAPAEITSKLPFLSTATTSATNTANMTHLLTPWGTQRIFINELSTNATDGTGDASVRSIFEAFTGLNGTTMNTSTNSTYELTGQGLHDIFGGNFSAKYTPAGVKQIAANMLQMRDPNTISVNASFLYNGSVLHDALGTTGLYRNLPTNYSANTPYPVVNEIAATAAYGDLDTRMRLVITFWIELYNPYYYDYYNTTNASICFMLDKIQFQTSATGNIFVGVDGINQHYYDYQTSNQHDYYKMLDENDANIGLSGIREDPKIKVPNIRSRSTETISIEFYTHWWRVSRGGNIYPGIANDTNTNSITGNITIGFERIALLANHNDPNSIRDGISGNDIGNYNIMTSDIYKVTGINSNRRLPQSASSSVKRIDPRIKAAANGGPTNTVIITPSNTITKNGSNSQDNIVPTPDITSADPIPGDPIYDNDMNYLVASNSSMTADRLDPLLPFAAHSSPADLGKVPTNTPYRSLRMQMQPAIEGTRIPDWAMLDVISFCSTNTSNPSTRQHPVNINRRFRLPTNVTNTAPPAPRTIGIQALAKVLENSTAGSIQDPMNPANSPPTDATRFRGNTVNATMIVNNIGNMTWSAGSTWANRRSNKNFPTDQYILPSEIMEIAGVADAVDQTDYENSTSHFKWNEGRASALIPAVTTRSSFFTIYAYAQAGRENPTTNQFEVDSEALTKTLVEVEIITPATASAPAQYKVKKLYSQNLPLGD
jgi:hypothetical protein